MKIRKRLLLILASLTLSCPAFSLEAKIVLEQADTLKNSDYNIPSWVKFLAARKTAQSDSSETNIRSLQSAMDNLEPYCKPFNLNMTINGDPSSQMGFCWYTNQGVERCLLEVVESPHGTDPDFSTPLLSLVADASQFSTNYIVSGNTINGVKVSSLTGLSDNSKQSYISHKVLADNLSANTRYSFRVGGINQQWSDTGSFKTASASKDPFSFIYITDTQANSDANFNVSSQTVRIAKERAPEAQFLLITGDLVETSGSSNSEWEWEQWFSSMQSTWNHLPIVPMVGNHDTSGNNNFSRHFNTDRSYNKGGFSGFAKSDSDGSNYSFVIGDALFMVIEFETGMGLNTSYLKSVANWMRIQVSNYPDMKWKIVCFHKNIYTGAKHQADMDIKTVRNNMAAVFDELKIDLALQGHDHVYEVIGPVYNKKLVANSVYEVLNSDISGVKQNMTGKEGGTFNTLNGTLYFVNNSAGKKKYDPNTEKEMNDSASGVLGHGLSNYWSLFTGKLAQTGEPTFSLATISSEDIHIQTFAVNDLGQAYLFDQFSVVNRDMSTSMDMVESAEIKILTDRSRITVQGGDPLMIELYDGESGQLLDQVRGSSFINLPSSCKGFYIVRIIVENKNFISKILI